MTQVPHGEDKPRVHKRLMHLQEQQEFGYGGTTGIQIALPLQRFQDENAVKTY
jgi:hypothetical protein